MEYSEAKVKDIFVDFLKSYVDETGELKYRIQISQIPIKGSRSVIVDYSDLERFDTDLATSLVKEPDLFLKGFDSAAVETLNVENPTYADKAGKELRVRIRELSDRISLRGVTKNLLNTLIQVAGMVTRTSELKPLAVNAAFRCSNQHITFVEQNGSGVILKRPIKCETEGCGETKNFELDDLKTEFLDFQVIRIQEMPEELPPGQLPQSFDVNLTGDMVNAARPGDRIFLTGIVKAESENIGGYSRKLFNSRIEANFVEQMSRRPEEQVVTREEEETIRSLAALPGAYDRLVLSVAPAIFGHELHKEAALLLMVGSPQKTLPDGTTLRGDINVLLVGDPGTAKSELLKYVSRAAPRGLFTSGRGSTAAGLTAAVVKEKNGMMMLEAGATVLADLGVACIDEFDKLREEDRSALHEVMEQQSYHPSFEISFANGNRQGIGEFVEALLRMGHGRIIIGKDCEILPLADGPEVYSCNISNAKITRIRVDRISRHKAPDSFVIIKYANGRKIIVTPDHPIYVYRNNSITTVSANQLSTEDYAPVPRVVPNSSAAVALTVGPEPEQRSKTITLPVTLTPDLSRLLGFLVTEGHSYAGSSYEIRFSNADNDIVTEVRMLFARVFDISPCINEKQGVITQTYISKTLFEWFLENFPELMQYPKEKRVPTKIRGASVGVIREFLASAFLGDGSVESTRISYRTCSLALAEDYQDLLHKQGIFSRVVHDNWNDSYKVCIMGDSISSFFEKVTERGDRRFERLRVFQLKSSSILRGHDTLPPQVAEEITVLMKKLGIAHSHYFLEHRKRNFGVNRVTVEKYLRKIEGSISKFEEFSRTDWANLRSARSRLRISQQMLGDITGTKRRRISYLEAGGYRDASEVMIQHLKQSVASYVPPLRFELEKLRSLLEYRFLRISEATVVPNEGLLKTDWVYDVTVEPTNNFLSKGLILHNTCSVAKGGIIATLNARTSILAAANPQDGKYDPYKNILENVSLPIPLLTRFDLIFIIRDEPDQASDETVAKHILDMRAKSAFPLAPPVEFDLLKKYIVYAKKLDPELTEEAGSRLSSYYIKLRREATPEQISVTPRWLEGMVRLSIARARILLHPRVTEDDALHAVNLIDRMLRTVAIDQSTKKVDVGVLYNKPISEKGLREAALDVFKRLSGESKQPVEDRAFYEEMEKTGKFNREQVEKVFQDMWKSGVIYEVRAHHFKKA